MEKFKEHFTMVQGGESTNNIIGGQVYSRISTHTR